MRNAFRQRTWAGWFKARAFALSYQDFRLLSGASILWGIGFGGEFVVVTWVVLDQTDSPFMVGLALGVRMAPQLVLGIPAGALADRFDRRVLLRLLMLASALVSGLLGVLLWADSFALWLLFVLLTVSGGLQALHQTARQSFVYDIVGRSQAVSGLAMVTLAMRLGGLAGSLAAGAVTARMGAGASFLAMTVAYGGAFALLLFVRSRGQAAPPLGASMWRSLREYFQEIRRNRVLLVMQAAWAC
jgi:MFS family permease